MENHSFTLGDVEYPVRITLRLWLELEEKNKTIVDFMKGKDMLGASATICSYLSTFTKLDAEVLQSFFWMEIANAYSTIVLACIPATDFPLLHGNKEKENPASWDYEGRTWYIWSHLIASKYGWTLDIIENLYFEDAIALIQEIMLDEQLEKEWQWSLSELAYPYNKTTKKSEFKALPRPSWMKEMPKISKEPEVARIPLSMIPQGKIIRWGESNEEIVH